VIVCRSPKEIERLRTANRFVAEVLAKLAAAVAPGVTTDDLDRLAEQLVREGGAEPAFKGIAAIRRRCAPRSTRKWCMGFRRRAAR
jgi:methionine aminopeptidase